jgi:hypothetical protein
MDLPEAAENLDALRNRFPAVEILPISAAESEGLAELKARLKDWLFSENPGATGEPAGNIAAAATCE